MENLIFCALYKVVISLRICEVQEVVACKICTIFWNFGAKKFYKKQTYSTNLRAMAHNRPDTEGKIYIH